MRIENQESAPYAPTKNVIDVLRRQRQSNLPEEITNLVLSRLGIPEGMENRTMRALRFLGLIDEEGRQTPAFRRLHTAGTEEYPELLAQVIREAYANIFAVIGPDPSQVTSTQIEDAFRHYQPSTQRSRMVYLFTALCQEAQMMPEEEQPVARATTRRRATSRRPPAPSASNGQSQRNNRTPPPDQPPPASGTENRDYGLLHGFLSQLPQDGKWSQQRKEQWLAAVKATIDLLTETTDSGA